MNDFSPDLRPYKLAFAEALAKEPIKNPDAAFRAAVKAFPGENGKAWQYYLQFFNDFEVQAMVAQVIIEADPVELLPTKEELCVRIMTAADQAAETRDKLKGYELLAEIMGFRPKENKPAVNVSVQQNKVMVVRDFGGEDAWETALVDQQAKLLAHAAAVSE